jgi:hypothetical protein
MAVHSILTGWVIRCSAHDMVIRCHAMAVHLVRPDLPPSSDDSIGW